jgi:hypothetical protein
LPFIPIPYSNVSFDRPCAWDNGSNRHDLTRFHGTRLYLAGLIEIRFGSKLIVLLFRRVILTCNSKAAITERMGTIAQTRIKGSSEARLRLLNQRRKATCSIRITEQQTKRGITGPIARLRTGQVSGMVRSTNQFSSAGCSNCITVERNLRRVATTSDYKPGALLE